MKRVGGWIEGRLERGFFPVHFDEMEKEWELRVGGGGGGGGLRERFGQ